MLTASLTTHPSAELLMAIESSLDIRTQGEFLHWTQNELQLVFPHGALLASIGDLLDGAFLPRHCLSHHLPRQHHRHLHDTDHAAHSPILHTWLDSLQPQTLSWCVDAADLDAVWIGSMLDHGLHNLAAHGLVDQERATVSYFEFFAIPGVPSQYQHQLLDALIPHLHGAITRVFPLDHTARAMMDRTTPRLTRREVDVLQWLRVGKTNSEIADILGTSVNTVKHQVRSTLMKLGVSNRAHAVANALEQGLIDLPARHAQGLRRVAESAQGFSPNGAI